MASVVAGAGAAGGPQGAIVEDESASVGVLGWLGFIIINAAAIGLITAGTGITWVLGLAFSIVYSVTLIVLALFLDRKGARFKEFVNLMWVLACIFIFVCGVYLSINVIGAIDSVTSSDDTYDPPAYNDDLSMLLPGDSSEELKDWASQHRVYYGAPTFASFAGQVFFQGSQASAGDAAVRNILLRSDVATTAAVVPELQDPYSFIEFDSRLFFSAHQAWQGRNIWVLEAAEAAGGSPSLFMRPGGDGQGYEGDAGGLFVDADTGKLFFQVQYYCKGIFTNTIFRSDGTMNGTEDLRGRCSDNTTYGYGGGVEDDMELPPAGELWGMLFLADLPMVVVAGIVFAWRKLPGLFTNIYAGLYIGILIIFLLLQDDTSNLSNFLKWSITIYSSLCYLAIVAVSVLAVSLPPWQTDLQIWAVVLVGATFFSVIHFDLEVPLTNDAVAWVVYSLLAALQMGISVLIRRTFPMVCGAIGAFVVAWKIADAIVDAVGAGLSSDVKTISMFGLLALQGVGIIVASILYARKRAKVEEFVRTKLLRSKDGEASTPLP